MTRRARWCWVAVGLAAPLSGCGSGGGGPGPAPARRRAARRKRLRELRARTDRANEQLARRVAGTVLDLLAFGEANVSATRGGRAVAITVPAGRACTARPADEDAMVRAVRRPLPFVRSVTVGVEGSD